MTTRVKADLCIIGMDPAGYDLALGAAQLGATVVLVTHRQSSGQVLLGSGRLCARLPSQSGSQDGLRLAIRARMAEADKERSFHRPPALGITVIDETARFLSPRLLEAGEKTIAARRFLLATGRTSPLFPQDDPQAGLNPFLAGEALPRALRLIGHDAEAVAMAQKLALAGIPIELDTGEAGLLPGHDAEAVAILASRLRRDGVTIRATSDGTAPSALVAIDVTTPPAYAGVHDPEKAGITLIDGLPACNDRLRTLNKRVYAIGALTETAREAKAGLVADGAAQIGWLIAKLLFRSFGAYPRPLAQRMVPTSPAIIALGEPGLVPGTAASVSTANRHRVFREPVPSDTGVPGFIKVTTDAKGRVLGAVIIAENAALLAAPWAASMQRREVLGALGAIPAFPGEVADATRSLSLQTARRRLQSPRLQGLVRFLAKFG